MDSYYFAKNRKDIHFVDYFENAYYTWHSSKEVQRQFAYPII